MTFFSLVIDLPNRIEISSIKNLIYINLESNNNGLCFKAYGNNNGLVNNNRITIEHSSYSFNLTFSCMERMVNFYIGK